MIRSAKILGTRQDLMRGFLRQAFQAQATLIENRIKKTGDTPQGKTQGSDKTLSLLTTTP